MDNSVYVEVIGKFLVKSSPYSFKLVSIEALNKLTPLSPNTRSAWKVWSPKMVVQMRRRVEGPKGC